MEYFGLTVSSFFRPTDFGPSDQTLGVFYKREIFVSTSNEFIKEGKFGFGKVSVPISDLSFFAKELLWILTSPF